MRASIKKTIWTFVILFGALVAFANSIPLWIGYNCQKPLYTLVRVNNPTPTVSLLEFGKTVEKAVTEWETKTNLNLFEIVKQGEAANTITAIYRDLGKVPQNTAGWTDAKTIGKRVKKFEVEIYNTSPQIMYQVLLHELGHARGLKDHSTNPEDIMFEDASYKLQNLSETDVQKMIEYCQQKQ